MEKNNKNNYRNNLNNNSGSYPYYSDMSPQTADEIRYVAAFFASFLMKGRTLDEIKNLYAVLLLLTQNVQAEISLRALFPVGPLSPLRPPISDSQGDGDGGD